MIVILGLVILVAAVIAGVARVLANGGHAHAVTHFAVFGYHVTGSTGTLFLYGIVIGVLGMLGLSLLLAARAGPPAAAATPAAGWRSPAARPPPSAGPRRPARPARHRPCLHRQHAGRRRHRPERQRSGPARAQPVRAPVRAPARFPAARGAGQPGPRPRRTAGAPGRPGRRGLAGPSAPAE